jgi:hypothetical protein
MAKHGFFAPFLQARGHQFGVNPDLSDSFLMEFSEVRLRRTTSVVA